MLGADLQAADGAFVVDLKPFGDADRAEGVSAGQASLAHEPLQTDCTLNRHSLLFQ